MVEYEFKGATSALYSSCGIWEMEHENGSYSAWVSKVNIGNSILLACSAGSLFKPVKVQLFSCAMGIIALGASLKTE